CAPRGPSSGEMCGPSTWNPSMHKPSGSDALACASIFNCVSNASGELVIRVGKQRVTPVACIAFNASVQSSAFVDVELKSTPQNPFTCRSMNPDHTYLPDVCFSSTGSTLSMARPNPISISSPVNASRPVIFMPEHSNANLFFAQHTHTSRLVTRSNHARKI